MLSSPSWPAHSTPESGNAYEAVAVARCFPVSFQLKACSVPPGLEGGPASAPAKNLPPYAEPPPALAPAPGAAGIEVQLFLQTDLSGQMDKVLTQHLMPAMKNI